MKIVKITVLVISAFCLYSCGGVVGNIKMKTFNCDSLVFRSCIDTLFANKYLLKPDSLSPYKDDEESKIALVYYKKDTFAFAYEINQAENRKNSPMLIITHFAKNHEVLEFESNLTRSQRKSINDIYETIILPNLKKCNCEEID